MPVIESSMTMAVEADCAGEEARLFKDAFLQPPVQGWDEDLIAVCVPLYNEDPAELLLTLTDIYHMQADLQAFHPNKRLAVCLIQDGWQHIHPGTRALFRQMFPELDGWDARMDELLSLAAAERPSRTLILQRRAGSEGVDLGHRDLRQVAGEDFAGAVQRDRRLPTGCHLDITVILKVDNRKKHNSHDLYFRGFVPSQWAAYAFATDCGTLFKRDCLTQIFEVMLNDETCIACTGRQRVMTKWMQPGCANEGPLGWALRVVQGYDYEASTVMYNSCFSLFGCLAVIPGPCGLFRVQPLLELASPQNPDSSPFGWYARQARAAEESGALLDGNKILAEDRVLTYAGRFKATPPGRNRRRNWTVRWAKGAAFYFQSECELGRLVAQRRRWLNGTIASYIFVLSELGREMRPGSGVHFRQWCSLVMIRFLTLLMLLIYTGIALGPSVYAYAFVSSLRYLMSSDAEWKLESFSIPIAFLLYAVYVCFACVHHFAQKYDARLFALVSLLNAACAAVMLGSLVLACCRGMTWEAGLALVYLLLPVLLNALAFDHEALRFLLNPFNFLVYLLFLPTMQGYFLTLAIARTFDLSWGNRAGIGAEQDGLKVESQALMVLQGALNFVVMLLTFHFNTGLQEFMNIFLAAFLLLPVAFIALFSAVEALGLAFSALLVLLEAALLWGALLDKQLLHHLPGWLRQWLIGVREWFLTGLVALALVFALKACCVLLYKGYRRWRRGPRRAPALDSLMCQAQAVA